MSLAVRVPVLHLHRWPVTHHSLIQMKYGKRSQERVWVAHSLPIRGCVQLFQVISALTTSVLAESCRQPEELARTAITSERLRMRSTTVRIFPRGGSMIWTYQIEVCDRVTYFVQYDKRTSGSGHRGSVSSATSTGFITSMRTS